MKTLALFLSIIFFAGVNMDAQTNWVIDKSHSKVGFTVTHLVISEVDGNFSSYDGKVSSKGDDFEGASIEFTVDINSIDTDNKDRDNHLKSDDFFNAEKFPKMSFKSKSLKKVSGKNFKLVGDLTIRDVTKQVELDVIYNGTTVDPWGQTKAGFKITGEVNRFDYNLKWNTITELGGAVVGKEVTLKINLQLIKS